MRRVRVIYLLRRVSESLLLKAAGFALLLGWLSFFVSVLSVLQNAWKAIAAGGMPLFVMSAFGHTGIIVQVLCVAALVVFAFLIRDSVRKIGSLRLSVQ